MHLKRLPKGNKYDKCSPIYLYTHLLHWIYQYHNLQQVKDIYEIKDICWDLFENALTSSSIQSYCEFLPTVC